MYHERRRALTECRELVGELRQLGAVEAPDSCLADVLARIQPGDLYITLDTPLGRVFVAYNDVGLSAVMRAATAQDFEQAFQAQFGRSVRQAVAPPAALVRSLLRALSGEGRPELRFDLRGISEFERAVLLKALEIPRGEVRSYAWVAREIGHPAAVRAVGSALGRNPIPLFIPCHRVVRSDGQIGHYGLGGREAKRTILAAEGAEPDALEALARTGVRYVGSDTTHVFCLPTCRHARRITPGHRVSFGSEGQAVAAGYRPCSVCRPAQAS